MTDSAASITTDTLSGPRLLILTDIGGDPDDRQSMIRLMVHADEFEIEGLIASASGTRGELERRVTRPDLIREIITAYGEVWPNLRLHSPAFPDPERLLARMAAGNRFRGLEAVGARGDTDGSRRIIQALDRDDRRPLNVVIWGGQTDLAQALWRLREERGPRRAARAIAKLRVYDINDQDGLQHWIASQFPGAVYILSKAPEGVDKRLGGYRGMYLGGDEKLTSTEWVEAHVKCGHGPLGALYPMETWTAPNPHSTLKEGDTPSWLYFFPTGLGDPDRPEWGSWGGRFRRAAAGTYRQVVDVADGFRDARAAVWRWRDAFQREFQARMDWCVEPPDAANHPPLAVLNGDESRDPVRLQARPGRSIALSAEGSGDPDGDDLAYRWWHYPEPGTCPGPVGIDGADRPTAEVRIPEDAAGTELHVILEITDTGTPPLTRYRRAVFTALSP